MHGAGVNIEGVNLACAEQLRGNGEDPRPRANVEDPITRAQVLLDRRQTETGSLMLPGPERYAGIEGNDDLVRGTEAAVARWQTIYGDIGIDLDVTLQVWNGPSTLAPPAIGDGDSWLSLAQGKDLRTINVVMAPFVEGGRGVYGVAGSIPGALRATDRSGVLINASEALGVDGVLSAADERLLSETLAHEVGHYLGLYHPVESSYALWDSLEDTDQCTSASSCANILGDNMMFPSPVCESEPCTPENLVSQTMITHDQAAVAHRYTGVD